MEKEIIFVTHNPGKVISAQKYFDHTKVKLKIYDYELQEPRSDDIQFIATAKVKEAYQLVQKPCFAIDTCFWIDSLCGFPRAFVNFALDTIGIEGILKLMKDVDDRNCHFGECVAYYDGNEVQYFNATIPGTIAQSILTGNDPEEKWSKLWYIFKPEGYNCTMAQLSKEQRQERSKTAQNAIKDFAYWVSNS